MWNAGLDEAQAGIKIARRNINNLRYADDSNLMAESEEELKRLFMKDRKKARIRSTSLRYMADSEEELKSLLLKVKEESEKVVLKLNIQKTQIMASCPIT